MKNDTTKNKEKTQEEILEKADETKREFIKKFGKYAASAPLMGIILMTPETSRAQGTSNSDLGPG